MPSTSGRVRYWPLRWGLLACALWHLPVVAATPPGDPAAFLIETESLRTKDHPQFVRRLAEIRPEVPRLAPAALWHFRYLDAWETMFEGDYAKSEALLHEVIDQSGDATLAAKSSALLLTNLGANRRYEEAFALANRLTTGLPAVKDSLARSMLLMNLSQMFNLAGQTDLAIQYADMMERATPAGDSLCYPRSLRVAALNDGKRLGSSSPELSRAIDTCATAGQQVIANTMRLVLIDRLLDEHQARKALALLDTIAPRIRENQYYPHILSSQVQRAKAYEELGDDPRAKTAALAAVALVAPSDLSEWARDAYGVLYGVAKRQGDSAAALSYYEQYVIQDKGYLNDITARGLAFELSKQHLLVQKLETERLARQNSILRLQKALETKAVETSRLYIVLLLLFLASVVFWLLRIKRSQLRFRKLSWHDGLTGIFNRQHFMNEAGRNLRLLEKRKWDACLVFIDLDHFKQINDTHGHAMGDLVLKHAVAICQQQLRPGDVFGRLGGEEFGMLLVGCPAERGLPIVERLRMAIEASPVTEEGTVIPFSTSAGLAATATSGYDLQRLCREADIALYKAKRGGRNRVVAGAPDSVAES
ncbi:diguanylate cyclase (GGDEF)-like protein [Luteibacter sp. W1I16]|uniref:GGDEF domain-containing protein n=1 Tax=Luteibacter sp. W1I16 TaxID=3373922 RepID=UPI003D1B4E70